MNELDKFGPHVSSSNHYWLIKDELSDPELRWMESCVAHLRVRIVKLPDWQSLKDKLRKALKI